VTTSGGINYVSRGQVDHTLLCSVRSTKGIGSLPRKARPRISEKKLSKGHLRKLNALRKSLGAMKTAETITKLATAGEVRIPRGAMFCAAAGDG
jgi:hypothetical protein